MQDLMRCGVPIEGEAGKGYRMLAGYQVPPLMFDDEELRTLAFGAEVAKAWGDESMRDAADRVLDKIAAVLPSHLHSHIAMLDTYVPDIHVSPVTTRQLGMLRESINKQKRAKLAYRDAKERSTVRIVWPLGLVYWGASWTLAAWCELREGFRSFRLDRIQSIELLQLPIPNVEGRTLDDYFALSDR
jgi:predicted DNA-binding transcriptional regulator YafY